jgi:cytochrome c oxidase subunit 2
VIPEADFSAWYFGDSAEAPVLSQAGAAGTPDPVRGERIFKLKGCVSCHTNDGGKLVGPTWKGLYGSQVTVLAEGKEVTLTADADYVKRSIYHPPKEVVKGFAPQMPKADLSERDVDDLLAYIRSLR